MWLSAIKLAAQAGTHIFKKRQETKMLMADAQMMHARKMAQGEEAFQGKLLRSKTIGLEGRGGFDNFVGPILILAWAVVSDDPTAMDKVKLFFDMFSQLPSWFTNLWILVVASIYGIKGTQIFRGGMNKDKK